MDDILGYLRKIALTKEDKSKNANIKYLIEGFLPQKHILVLYGDSGSGKNWLSSAIAKKLCKKMKEVFFLDFDNPEAVLNERNIYERIVEEPNIRYIHRSKIDHIPLEFIEYLNKKALGEYFKDMLFILDNLQEFIDPKNERQAREFFGYLKNMRESGATIILLHHSNKDGKNYDGSAVIKRNCDILYKASYIPSSEGETRLMLELQKERARVQDKAFAVNEYDYSFKEIDMNEAKMSSFELSFVKNIREVLKREEGLSKRKLIERADYKVSDKTHMDTLDKFENIYWRVEKATKQGSASKYFIK